MLPFCWLLQMHTRTHKNYLNFCTTYKNNHKTSRIHKSNQKWTIFPNVFLTKKLNFNRSRLCSFHKLKHKMLELVFHTYFLLPKAYSNKEHCLVLSTFVHWLWFHLFFSVFFLYLQFHI